MPMDLQNKHFSLFSSMSRCMCLDCLGEQVIQTRWTQLVWNVASRFNAVVKNIFIVKGSTTEFKFETKVLEINTSMKS